MEGFSERISVSKKFSLATPTPTEAGVNDQSVAPSAAGSPAGELAYGAAAGATPQAKAEPEAPLITGPLEPSPGAGNAAEKQGRFSSLKREFPDHNLVIREFHRDDHEKVRSVCISHFRSLCFAAVRFYITEHLADLTFLLVLGKVFMTFKSLGLASVIFNLYLFVRARIEMEKYINHDCPDLKDIWATYREVNSEASICSNFWVAELIPNSKDASSSTSASGKSGESKIVGCIGMTASREDPLCGKVLRLVVDGSVRRRRIGTRLLGSLEAYAKKNGVTSLKMYTNTLNPTHVKFVRQNRFQLVQTIRRGLMRGDLMSWQKSLTKKVQSGLVFPKEKAQKNDRSPPYDERDRGNSADGASGEKPDPSHSEAQAPSQQGPDVGNNSQNVGSEQPQNQGLESGNPPSVIPSLDLLQCSKADSQAPAIPKSVQESTHVEVISSVGETREGSVDQFVSSPSEREEKRSGVDSDGRSRENSVDASARTVPDNGSDGVRLGEESPLGKHRRKSHDESQLERLDSKCSDFATHQYQPRVEFGLLQGADANKGGGLVDVETSSSGSEPVPASVIIHSPAQTITD